MDSLKRPPAIEFRQLQVFRVVAEELHFGRAAKRLGIAQPPLSQQIKRLEEMLGCRLFERDTRKVELTPSGAAFVEIANTVLAQLTQGIERVRDIANGEMGRLSIGFTSTTALKILPSAVRRFSLKYERVELELFELLPDVLIDALLSEQIDIGMLRNPKPITGVESVSLLKERFVAVLPAGHPLADLSIPFKLTRMAKDPFVLFARDKSSSGFDRMIEVCEEAGFTPNIVQKVPGWQTAISLVGSGLGVSLLPESVTSLGLPGIIYRPVESKIRSTISIVRRSDDLRPMVQNFISCASTVAAQ